MEQVGSAYYNLGAVLEDLGRVEEARTVWQKAMELVDDENRELAVEALAHYRH